MGVLSQKALSVVKKMQQNELTESVIYTEIAKFAKGEENKEVLLRLAKEEKSALRNMEKLYRYRNETGKNESFQI